MKTIKQIITVAALAMFMMTSFGAVNENLPIMINEVKINNTEISINDCSVDNQVSGGSVAVTIKLGRRSRGCKSGFGLCKVKKVKITIKYNKFQVKNSNGKLTLIMNKKGFEEINNYFKGNEIILEEDFVLSEDLSKELGFKERYVLKKGTYRISSIKDGSYSVIL